jgi:hypothetical protein
MADLLSSSTPETRFPIESAELAGFPFRRELSLVPLIAVWREGARRADGIASTVARLVEAELDRAPELLAPIEDLAVLARHQELVDVLMAKAFPAAFWTQDLAGALRPFTTEAFYATPSFRRLLLDERQRVRGQVNVDARSWGLARVLRAYNFVLAKYYGIDATLDYPLIVTTADPESRLERHFRIQFDSRFVELDLDGPLPPLSDAARARLVANLTDPSVLLELVPPGPFVFRGFFVLKAIDVTDQEVLSGLKRDLIEKESIVSTTRFQRLQAQLRTLFRRPDLRVGLAALQGERVLMLNYGCRLEHSCIFADSEHRTRRDFAGSIYERAVRQGHPLIVADLAAHDARTAIEDGLLATGVRNVVVAPLHYQEAVIGTLELGSPHPGDLDAMGVLKLREVLPLFSMAVQRSLEELNTRIQAVIKEQCTAIHPSVEWRFRQAVLNAIERRRGDGGPVELEPIVFRDVYPLYGIADIRGSSTQRNVAIQADLLAHLALARAVVEGARAARPLPILDELRHRLDRRVRQVELTLNSGDEVTILAFLRREVEPLFARLGEFGPEVRQRIDAYRRALDPSLGTVHERRRDYEESVTLLNETISAYLDAEQEMAQQMFPHYFEKQRTDGVDYSIYVGTALVEDGAFDAMYLRNLRLWQLLIACGVARRVEAVRDRLRVPLETTQLILAHHAPMSIRFRFDEKRFDVDGAYNVRYEVVKKRIDKGVVRGSGERVTQPGKIAIVYSQPDEGAEYRDYVDYLQASGHLTRELEELELEELQGVHGLRALRVTVDLGRPEPTPRPAARAAAAAVHTLGR